MATLPKGPEVRKTPSKGNPNKKLKAGLTPRHLNSDLDKDLEDNELEDIVEEGTRMGLLKPRALHKIPVTPYKVRPNKVKPRKRENEKEDHRHGRKERQPEPKLKKNKRPASEDESSGKKKKNKKAGDYPVPRGRHEQS